MTKTQRSTLKIIAAKIDANRAIAAHIVAHGALTEAADTIAAMLAADTYDCGKVGYVSYLIREAAAIEGNY